MNLEQINYKKHSINFNLYMHLSFSEIRSCNEVKRLSNEQSGDLHKHSEKAAGQI